MVVNESDQVIIADNPMKAGDFSCVLNEYKFVYTREDPYFLVGDKPEKSGWILELSVVRSRINEFVSRVIPFLYLENMSFRIVTDTENARHILDGNLGNHNVGRLISVYPGQTDKAAKIARVLILETKNFPGPAIPGSVYLGGAVYVSKAHYTEAQDWPFKEFAAGTYPKPRILLRRSYLRYSVISSTAKGNVEKGIHIKPFWRMNWCIIKQGKKAMLSDNLGFDMKDRLKWQKEIYQTLNGIIPVPQIIDLFEEKGDQFLIMEFIDGQTLDKLIPSLFNNKLWTILETKIRLLIIEYLLQIISHIGKLHQAGLVHRDITPANFIVTKKNKIFFIDMELAYSMKNNLPLVPFELGTYGYMSPEQLAHEIPTEKEDIYALGAFMLALFTCQNPIKLDLFKVCELRKELDLQIGNRDIVRIIIQCLNRTAHLRPNLEELKSVIDTYNQKLKQNA